LFFINRSLDRRKKSADTSGNIPKGRSRGKKSDKNIHKPAKEGAAIAQRGKDSLERGGYELASDFALNHAGKIRLRQREVLPDPPPAPVARWDHSAPIATTKLRADAKEFTFEPRAQPNAFPAAPSLPVFVPRSLNAVALTRSEDTIEESVLSAISLRADAREFVPSVKH
jgi:hypothetical protein